MARFENLSVNKLHVVSNSNGVPDGTPQYVIAKQHTVTADGTVTLPVAANTFVHCVYVRVDTAAGEVCTATVGDGDAADGWIADGGTIDLNATAGTMYRTLAADDGYEGKIYTSADTIDVAVTLNGGTGSVKFTIFAVCSKYNI